MLALTRKTDYALIALTYLARCQGRSGGVGASARQIAEAHGLPLPQLMNILKVLSQAKVLASTRGPRGGYRLAVAPERLTLLEVITAMEGPVQLTPCAEGLPVVGQGCELAGDCPVRGPIRSLHRRIYSLLNGLTLRDLCDGRLDESDRHEKNTGEARRGRVDRATLERPALADEPVGVEP